MFLFILTNFDRIDDCDNDKDNESDTGYWFWILIANFS